MSVVCHPEEGFGREGVLHGSTEDEVGFFVPNLVEFL